MNQQEIDNLKVGDYILWTCYNQTDLFLGKIVSIDNSHIRIMKEDSNYSWHYPGNAFNNTRKDLLNTGYSITTKDHYYKLIIFQ